MECWRVLYLFAGAEREADLEKALLEAIAAFNRSSGSAVALVMINLDILRGGNAHDLLSESRRGEILVDIKAGKFDLVLTAPPCASLSRALFSDLSYPFPLRDFANPRGFPHLDGNDLQKVQDANTLADFTVDALQAVTSAAALGWLEFPEDLGECRHGTPASLWQWKSVRDLSSRGYLRGAIYQCEWAPVDYRKPTGMLCNFSTLLHDENIYPGWPSFSPHDPCGRGRKYTGPLPSACIHGKHTSLIGKGEDGNFKTAGTAAYPPEMCRKLADCMVLALASRPAGRIRSCSPLVGAFVGVEYLFPLDLVSSELAVLAEVAEDIIPGHSGSLSWGLHALSQDAGIEYSVVGDLTRMKKINDIILEVVLRSGRTFPWTSLQLHRNVWSSPHADAGIETGLLVVFGDFEGGGFVQGKEVRVKDAATFFEPSKEHFAKEHTGDRFSLVAFRHPLLSTSSSPSRSVLADLAKAGFKTGVKELPSRDPPTRVQISKELVGKPGIIYIGRGHAGFGLPRSPWANPFKVSSDAPRKKVIKDFKRHLEQARHLLDRLNSLAGGVLACHCPVGLPCHGDVIIQVFKDRFCTGTEKPPDDTAISKAIEARSTESAGASRGAKTAGPSAPSVQAGHGMPIMVRASGRERLLVDGGGLCSPGLWPPWRRPPSKPLGVKIRQQLKLALFEEGIDVSMMMKAISAGTDVDPFGDKVTLAARKGLEGLASQELRAWSAAGAPILQNVQVRLLGSLLKLFEDPDWEAMKLYEEGVRIGVGTTLPRTPAVFEEKVKWRVPGQADATEEDFRGGAWRTNYSSATEHREEVEAVLREQASRGQVAIFSEKEAVEKFGSRLTVASLAAIQKGLRPDGSVEVRIVHDGTHGINVNSLIKVLDHVGHPAAGDVQRIMQECRESGQPYFAATADVQEAHRQVHVAPEDAPLQACQLSPGGPVFVNLVGTYGISSAGYWWGRLGAALTRLLSYVFGDGFMLWVLLFADDWLLLSGGRDWMGGIVYALLLLRSLGVPLSWRKVSTGFVVSWIGLEVNLKEWTLGISSRRAAWILGWLSKTIEDKSVDVRILEQAVGRMQFCYGVLVWDRPFLAPLYTLIHMFPEGGKVCIPPFALEAMKWLHSRLEARRSAPCSRVVVRKEALFRVDAKADGNDVAIGGWKPFYLPNGDIVKEKSEWFAFSLSPESAPWAFERGLPFKTISALELLATVVGIIAFGPASSEGERWDSMVTVSAQTDSQVASRVLGRALTTSFPLCLVAMEAAAQLEARGLDLGLNWVPREVNEEADALSNFRFGGFSEDMRIYLDMADLPFLTLPKLLKVAADFYAHAKKVKAAPGLSSLEDAQVESPTN